MTTSPSQLMSNAGNPGNNSKAPLSKPKQYPYTSRDWQNKLDAEDEARFAETAKRMDERRKAKPTK